MNVYTKKAGHRQGLCPCRSLIAIFNIIYKDERELPKLPNYLYETPHKPQRRTTNFNQHNINN